MIEKKDIQEIIKGIFSKKLNNDNIKEIIYYYTAFNKINDKGIDELKALSKLIEIGKASYNKKWEFDFYIEMGEETWELFVYQDKEELFIIADITDNKINYWCDSDYTEDIDSDGIWNTSKKSDIKKYSPAFACLLKIK